MTQRPYTRITVQDIIDRADVGRSTFYAHYRDKDDLLLVSCTEHVRAVISSELAGHRDAPALAAVRILFRLAGEHPDVYRPLLGRRTNAVVLRSVRRMYAELLTEYLGPRLDPATAEATVVFLSWGLYGLLEAAVDPHDPLTPDTAYQRFAELWTGSRPAGR